MIEEHAESFPRRERASARSGQAPATNAKKRFARINRQICRRRGLRRRRSGRPCWRAALARQPPLLCAVHGEPREQRGDFLGSHEVGGRFNLRHRDGAPWRENERNDGKHDEQLHCVLLL